MAAALIRGATPSCETVLLQVRGELIGYAVLLLPLIPFVGPWLLVGHGLYRFGRGVGWSRRSPGKCKKCGTPLQSGICAARGATWF